MCNGEPKTGATVPKKSTKKKSYKPPIWPNNTRGRIACKAWTRFAVLNDDPADEYLSFADAVLEIVNEDLKKIGAGMRLK